jgi:hypothetical protein
VTAEPRTVWRIRALENVRTGDRRALDVQLVVATTAQPVVEAIERAAWLAGVELERVEPVEAEAGA